MDTLTLRTPDDWHLHLRDGAALQSVVAASARQFGRAIVMPNLKPPIATVIEATAYLDRIRDALAKAVLHQEISQAQADSFCPLMTLYLTEKTSVDEIQTAALGDVVIAVKLYPAGATTNSDAGVTAIERVYPVLEAMSEAGLPLLVHGEVADPDIDVFDREAVFIDRVMIPLRQRFPRLKVVFEHITTQQAVEYVRTDTAPLGVLGATITPQHLLYNRNAIFTGGLRPHWYCLPVLKRETHRRALIEAATSGNPRFFLGTDSAPHARTMKEIGAACAGCYTGLHALALYAWAFDEADALDRLEGFASLHGARFFGLPPHEGHIVLQRSPWRIPQHLPFAGTEIVPLAAGEILPWQVVGQGRTA
ncbi:MAG: dihydroorotase [Lautropia sp.]|nr:dihydroorotase [Lautropia sp.]